MRPILLRVGVVATTVAVAWSVSGRGGPVAEGSPVCDHMLVASTAQYEAGEACPPEGFERAMGYEPILVRTTYGWRYTKPAIVGGGCSGPLSDRGPFWSFATACGAHDYAYDLVRFGVGDRVAADGLLYSDLMASCPGRGIFGTPACKALAEWARAGLRFGDATGMDPEPVSPA